MPPHGQQAKVEAHVPQTGIRLEDCGKSGEADRQQHGLLVEAEGQRGHVQSDGVDLEGADKQPSEMFKHFGKEVPEEAHVWSQVWHVQSAEIVLVKLGNRVRHLWVI